MEKLILLLTFSILSPFSGFAQWLALPIAQAPGGQTLDFIKPIANGVVFFSQSYPSGSHWNVGLNHISYDDLFNSNSIGMPSNVGPGNYNSTIVTALSEINKDTFAVNVYLSQLGSFSGGTHQTWLRGSNQYTNAAMPGFPAPLLDLNLTQNYLYAAYGSYLSSLNFSVYRRELSTGAITTFTSATYEWPGKMQFINDSVGYLLCKSKSNSAKNYLLKSIDYGVSWNPVFIDSISSLSSFHFPSLNTGYIVGKNGAVIKTVNGGNNWLPVTIISTSQTLTCTRFLNDSTGYVAGSSGFIVKTSNSGTSWLNEVTTCTNNITNLYSFDTVAYFSDAIRRLYKNSILTGTGINELSNQKNNLYAFPNPTPGVTTLKFDKPYTGQLILYDAIGNVVTISLLTSTESYKLDLGSFAEGVYFIRLTDNGYIKLIKQN